MGSESSIFKKCSISPEPEYTCKEWSLFNGKHDGHKLSIFMFNDTNYCFDVTHWKSIRHPNILKYYDWGVFRGKKCLVTECVEPLKPLVSKLSPELALNGLYTVAQALAFLHDVCKLSHNDVSLDSLFVSRAEIDCWKIGSLFNVSQVGSENSDFLKKLFSYHENYGSTNILPPEDVINNKIQSLKSNDEIFRRDVFAFGLLLNQLLPNNKLNQLMRSLRHDDIMKRPNMREVLMDEMFTKCDYVQIKLFLKNFASFNEVEKNVFFSSLVDRMRNISQNLVAHLVSSILTSRLIMSHPDVQDNLLPYILIPANDSDEEFLYQPIDENQTPFALKPLLNKRIFRSHVIPLICKMFCVRDLQIRIVLLKFLPYYCPLISKSCLQQLILPQTLLGIKDPNDELVSLTLTSLSHLVNFFGASVVMGPRVKLFSNGIPRLKEGDDSINCMNGSEAVPVILNVNMPERSSPDGGENSSQSSQSHSQKFNDLNQTQLENIEVQAKETSVVSTVSNIDRIDSKNKQQKSKLNINKDFDIKEIDFKFENNEIDKLFSDMEPILKFNEPKLISSQVMDAFNTSNIFAANEESVGEVGWTDHEWDHDWEQESN